MQAIAAFLLILDIGSTASRGTNNVSISANTRKPIKVTPEITASAKHRGCLRLTPLEYTRCLNRRGVSIKDIIRTELMPIMDTRAMDLMAGWPAKTSTPKPPIVVRADISTDTLYRGR